MLIPTWLIVVVLGTLVAIAAFSRRGVSNGAAAGPQGLQDPNRSATGPLDPHQPLGLGTMYEHNTPNSSTRYVVSQEAIIAGATVAANNRAALVALVGGTSHVQPASSPAAATSPAPNTPPAQAAQTPHAPQLPTPTPPTIKLSGKKANVVNAPAGGKIEWGDGKDDVVPPVGKKQHTYAATGKYKIEIFDAAGNSVAEEEVDVK